MSQSTTCTPRTRRPGFTALAIQDPDSGRTAR